MIEALGEMSQQTHNPYGRKLGKGSDGIKFVAWWWPNAVAPILLACTGQASAGNLFMDCLALEARLKGRVGG